MTNKIEISRELAQKVDDLLYILTGHDSHTKMTRKYGEEFWIPIDQMRAELCTAIAAPSVERQEPVGFRYRAHGGHWEWMDESPFADGREHYKLGGEELQPLYTSPPTPSVERQPVAYVLTRDDDVCYEADDGIVISNTPGDETSLYKWKPVYFDTSPPAPVAVVLDERAEFEKHCKSIGLCLLPSLDGGYRIGYGHEMWSGWQARACLDKIKEMNR